MISKPKLIINMGNGSNNKVRMQFLGAAGTVTGSKTLITANGKKILIDCGLFQGIKKLRQLNWLHLPFDASELLSGANDHS